MTQSHVRPDDPVLLPAKRAVKRSSLLTGNVDGPVSADMTSGLQSSAGRLQRLGWGREVP